MFEMTNKTAIITGAAGNLGQAVARAMLASGAHLVLVDRAPGRLAARFPDLVNDPANMLATSVDLTDEAAVTSLAAEVVRRFGRIDVLVNTAGGYRGGSPVHTTSLEAFDAMLALNTRTMLIASRAVIPQMIAQQDGRIVNVSARLALKGATGSAAYGASKSAVLHLSESMAVELNSHHIRVNCVLPGTIDTPANREAMPRAAWSKWTTPEAIADVILFLASDAARAVTGAAIPV